MTELSRWYIRNSTINMMSKLFYLSLLRNMNTSLFNIGIKDSKFTYISDRYQDQLKPYLNEYLEYCLVYLKQYKANFTYVDNSIETNDDTLIELYHTLDLYLEMKHNIKKSTFNLFFFIFNT